MFEKKTGTNIKLLPFIVTIVIFITRIDILGLFLNGFLLCLCLMCLLHKRISPVSEEIKGYVKAFVIYLACIIPSILFSDKPRISLIVFCLTLFQYGCFATIILFIRRREYLVTMLSAFFLFSGVDCMFAMVQLLTGKAWANRGYGFSGALLSIADIMCVLLPIVLVVLMDQRFEKELKKTAAFATVGIVIGLICNKSRGAWLTELIVVPVTVFRYLKNNRKYLVIFTLVLLGMVGYMANNPQYVQRINSITNTTTDHSNADRIWAWKSSKRMVQDYPITGVGFGMFHDKYEENYKYVQETQGLMHTHNNFIQSIVECGIIGVLGLLYLVYYFLFTSLQNYRKNKNPYDLLVFAIFFAHVCVFGQIDYTIGLLAGAHPIFLFLLAVLFQLKETDWQVKGLKKELARHET